MTPWPWPAWALCAGQFLSLCNTGSAICCRYLVREGFTFPTLQSLGLYIFITISAIILMLIRRNKSHRSIKLNRKYIFLFILLPLSDVEGNYGLVRAYEYLSMSTVMLLDALTIPFVLLITRIFLRQVFRIGHILAAIYTLIGVFVLVFVVPRPHTSSNSVLIGTAWTAFGCLGYAVSNTVSEALLCGGEGFSVCAVLLSLGVGGTLASGIQILFAENNVFHDDIVKENVLLIWFIYTLFLWMMYMLTPVVIEHTSAACFNISLLSSDAMTVAAAVIVFHEHLNWFFFVAFIIIVTGIALYHSVPPPRRVISEDQYQVMSEPN